MISLHHPSTWSSTADAASSKPPTFQFSPAAIISAKAGSGEPVPITQPQKRGCRLPVG